MSTVTTKTPTAGHGWRITWPMVLGWLTTLAMLVPFAEPYIKGEKPFDASAALALFAVVVAHLNHSPTPSSGGGLPRPPAAATTLLVGALAALTLSACGAGWQGHARDTLGLASRATVFADRVVVTQAAAQCPDHAGDCLHAHHIDVAYDSIAAAKSAIATGEQALLHALDTGVENLWSSVAPCLGATIAEVLRALADAGVTVPPWVNDAAALVIAILGSCASPAGGAS